MTRWRAGPWTDGPPPGAPATRKPATGLALHQLDELAAVRASLDAEHDTVTLDMSDLVKSVLISLEWLVAALAATTGETPEAVTRALQAFLASEV